MVPLNLLLRKRLVYRITDFYPECIIAAVKEVGVSIPVIVRLEGTNAPLAREILAKSGLAITPASDLTDAAKKAVSMAGAHS